MMDNQPSITVSELTRQIKAILEGTFPEIWVEGEISNFIHHSSGHMYFTLKDSNSEIRCVMFKGNNQFLRFRPENGMKVILLGRISVYAPRGQYQLVVNRMDPAGIGTLFLAFEALKKQLASEGLFSEKHKKELPPVPKRIGLITSKTGAAVQDMFQVFKRRAPYVELVLRPTLVQGDEAAGNLVDALDEMDRFGDVDIIIIGRGGGSLEDLWPFNEEIVARKIFECSTPIISAVGHETDTTISDMVSDLRAPTPSAAAELAATSREDLLSQIRTLEDTILIKMSSILEQYYQKTDSLHNRFFQQQPLTKINQMKELNYHLKLELKQFIYSKFLMSQNQFDKLFGELSILNPKNILSRGYSIATNENGKIIFHPDEISLEESFLLQLPKGLMVAEKKNTVSKKEGVVN